MIMRYKGIVCPALSLEMVRSSIGVKKIEVYYDEVGVKGVVVGNIEILTDRFGRLLIGYKKSLSKPNLPS